ncbi:heme lyase CcmF/NrfE family subunit, partial [Myxococcota bacterium]|nr:heme lyase CcmF/NrfE family subunit [Myxococcota bacterium]
TAFLVNNLLIALLLFTVFLGTIYPLVTEAFKGIKVSVGEPYFNKMAGPIGLALTLLMGLAPILPWGRPNMRAIGRAFTIPAAFGVAIAILSLALGMRAPMVIITFGVVAFSTWITIQEMVMPIVLRIKKRGEGFGTALQRAVMGNRRRYGGYIVHLSIFMIVGAVSVSQAYKETIDVSMHRGENFDIGNYNLKLIKMEGTQEPHRFVVHARLDVFDKENNPLGSLAPSLNYYTSQREPMGTPDVRTNLYEDLYVSLLSFEDDGSAAVLKVFVTPGVAWIWWSMPVMMFGTAISLWPRRRKVRVQAKSTTDIDETKAEVSAT